MMDNKVIEGVPRTSIFIAACRSLVTNHYISKCNKNKDNNNEDVQSVQVTSYPYYQIQTEYYHYFVPTLQVDGLDDHIAIYDPFAYFFATHPISIELLIQQLTEMMKEEEEKEKEQGGDGKGDHDHGGDIELNIRKMVMSNHPLVSWQKMFSLNAIKRVGKRTLLIDHLINKYVINPTGREGINNSNVQLVILGSGLDCRSSRLPFQDTVKVFELDLPDVIEYKQTILGHISSQHLIPTISKSKNYSLSADLSVPGTLINQLTSHGYDKSVPTFWVMEGFLMYLDDNETEVLMNDIASLTCASNSFILYHTLIDGPHLMEYYQRSNFKSWTNTPTQLTSKHGFHLIQTFNYRTINTVFNILNDDTPDRTSEFTLVTNNINNL